jgi:hypothetical protein
MHSRLTQAWTVLGGFQQNPLAHILDKPSRRPFVRGHPQWRSRGMDQTPILAKFQEHQLMSDAVRDGTACELCASAVEETATRLTL